MKKFIMVLLIIVLIIGVFRCCKHEKLEEEESTTETYTVTTTTKKNKNYNFDFEQSVQFENVSLTVSSNYELHRIDDGRIFFQLSEDENNKTQENANYAAFTLEGATVTEMEFFSDEGSIGTYFSTGSYNFTIPKEMEGSKIKSAQITIKTQYEELQFELIRL